MQAQIEKKYTSFLKSLGADKKRHTNKILLTHLEGTYGLLKKWGHPEYLCLAGLFHSIYGTEGYSDACLPINERDQVTNLIGEESEKLVFLFCTTVRAEYLTALMNKTFKIRSHYEKRNITLTEEVLISLLEIKIANCVDTSDHILVEWPEEGKKLFSDLYLSKKLISEGAALDLSEINDQNSEREL